MQLRDGDREKRAFTIKEVVALTSICRSLIYQEITEGRLKVRKCGRRTVVLADDLDNWLTDLPATG